MKRIIYTILFVLISFSINFGIFLVSYKKLAFPYMHEAQRVENAPYIFTYVLASFLLVAVILGIFYGFATREKT